MRHHYKTTRSRALSQDDRVLLQRNKHISAIVMMSPHPAPLYKANQIAFLSMSDTLPSRDAVGLIISDSTSFSGLVSIIKETGILVVLSF